jgi:hypothetical protein
MDCQPLLLGWDDASMSGMVEITVSAPQPVNPTQIKKKYDTYIRF